MTPGDYVENLHTAERGRVLRVVSPYRIRVRFQFGAWWVTRKDLRIITLN